MPDSIQIQTWNTSPQFARTPKYKETRIWAWGRKTWLGEFARSWRKFRFEILEWMKRDRINAAQPEKLAQSIALLNASEPVVTGREASGEAPVFLLSTGWRAGSTLLQRVLVTDPRVLLWGEPLGDMAVVSRMAEMVAHSLNPHLVRLWERQADPNSIELATSWIANLYPASSDFRVALRSVFDQWMGNPARDRGFLRWGFKEVRLGATEATLLHWLYPNAKFVLIHRHPYECYRSMVNSRWEYYGRYPDLLINSAAKFAHFWNRLATSWGELPAGFPCYHIKYEDLISRKVNFRELESWLGLEIKENVALSAPVGGSAKGRCLTWYERMIIAHEAGAGMRQLGYSNARS